MNLKDLVNNIQECSPFNKQTSLEKKVKKSAEKQIGSMLKDLDNLYKDIDNLNQYTNQNES